MFGTQKKKEYEIWKNPRTAWFSPKIGTSMSNVGNTNNNTDKDETGSSTADFIFSKQSDLDEVFDQIYKRPSFSYDVESDPLYQQYKAQAVNQGKKAMQDTIGQASAMTGGYGNSYAVAAGNQAYQGYLENLNDVVPELYQLAYNKHNQEGQDLLNKYAMLSGEHESEYTQYRDNVTDEKWATELLLSGEEDDDIEDGTTVSETIKDVSSTIIAKVQGMSSNIDKANYLDGLVTSGTITENEADALFAEYMEPEKVSISERDWMLDDDGGINGWGGIDNDAVVKDQYGNEYRLDKLVNALVSEGMSKDEARAYVLKLQAQLGA